MVSHLPFHLDVSNLLLLFTFRSHYPVDISVGISSLFPTVYGGLYHFEPSEQGLLYLPMLAGSILGESATGSVSDWLAAAPHANFLALWVAKRTTATEIPELIPEMRLFLGLCGTLVSTVRSIQPVIMSSR